MMMTIDDILDMFIFPDDQEFAIYDMNEDVQAEIFKGYKNDLENEEMLFYEVESIDNIYKDNKGCITFNIATEDAF